MDYTETRNAVLELMSDLIVIASDRGAVTQASQLAAALRELREGKLRVVVCGEYNRGKSTLLNALLGDLSLLPEALGIATSVVTTIGYRETVRIRAQVADEDGADGELTECELTRDQLREYVTESGNRSSGTRVRQVDIEIPSDLLRSGLVLVDTPGVSGLEDAHARRTAAMTRIADAIVFVTDPSGPFSTGERTLLRGLRATPRLQSEADPFLFVITKSASLLPSERRARVAQTREAVAQELHRPADELRVAAVDSQMWQRYRETKREQDREVSNFPEFVDLLWATLVSCQAGKLLRGALTAVLEASESMTKPLQAALEALGSPMTTLDLLADAEKRAARLTEMTTPDAPWRRDLKDRMTAIEAEVTAEAVRESHRLWKNLANQIRWRRVRGTAITSAAADTIFVIHDLVGARLRAASEDLHLELAEKYGLVTGSTDVGWLPAPPVPELSLQAADGRRSRQVNLALFMALRSAVVVAFTAAMHMVVPVPVPEMTLLAERLAEGLGASALVTAAARRSGLDELVQRLGDSEQGRADLVERIREIARAMEASGGDYVASVARICVDSIDSELRDRVDQELVSAQESIRRLREHGPVDDVGLAAQRARLEAELAPLAEVIDRAKELASAARAIARPAATEPAGEVEAGQAGAEAARGTGDQVVGHG
jgi:hypothetical protein